MTSRTTDIHCEECGKYLFSTIDSKKIVMDHFCKARACQTAKTVAALQGKNVK